MGMRGGEFQESKAFASVGKAMCVWLIWKHADTLILHENALLFLMLILVMPDLVKKLITMRYGGKDDATTTG